MEHVEINTSKSTQWKDKENINQVNEFRFYFKSFKDMHFIILRTYFVDRSIMNKCHGTNITNTTCMDPLSLFFIISGAQLQCVLRLLRWSRLSIRIIYRDKRDY